jgi:hypothetical protein
LSCLFLKTFVRKPYHLARAFACRSWFVRPPKV